MLAYQDIVEAPSNLVQGANRNPIQRESSTQRCSQIENDHPVAVRITSHTDQQHEKYSTFWNTSLSPSKYPIDLWQF